jgi:hypothetical protein
VEIISKVTSSASIFGNHNSRAFARKLSHCKFRQVSINHRAGRKLSQLHHCCHCAHWPASMHSPSLLQPVYATCVELVLPWRTLAPPKIACRTNVAQYMNSPVNSPHSTNDQFPTLSRLNLTCVHASLDSPKAEKSYFYAVYGINCLSLTTKVCEREVL